MNSPEEADRNFERGEAPREWNMTVLRVKCPRCGSNKATVAPELPGQKMLPKFLKRWLARGYRPPPLAGRYLLECPDCGYKDRLIS
ncbi:MAG: hypothetical protein LBT40_15405 [Deltaproteobacteria bacterium]|jgi:DNA-directed RNA polymerase subunit RPC12/RpoP|nr:hypothetical protein [Deltaproteobacteria bacterium]